MSIVTFIPCSIRDESESVEYQTQLEVNSNYVGYLPSTLTDPEEKAGHEVYGIRLRITEQMRSLSGDTFSVTVEGRPAATVSLDGVEFLFANWFDIDDCDLRDEVAAWLDET